jgi:hypothetical protein
MPTCFQDLARDRIGDHQLTVRSSPTIRMGSPAESPHAYPAAWTASVALRAAINTGSHTGENGGA